MFGIGFDTPSTKDLAKSIEIAKKVNINIFQNNINKDFNGNDNDFLKIIVNDIGDILGLFNKNNYNYILFNENINIDNNIKKYIKFKYKK